MTTRGFRSNITIKCHAKRPKAMRRWVFMLLRALGWNPSVEFLVRLEVIG